MSKKTTWTFWDKKARELSWTMPAWVKRIESASRWQVLQDCARSPALATRALTECRRSWPGVKLTLRNMSLLKALSEIDFIAVYGEGAIHAGLAHVPFVAIPFGGDLTISAFRADTLGEMLRAAYAKACRILVGDPDFIDCLARLGLPDRWTFFPCPIDTDRYAPGSASLHDVVEHVLPDSWRDSFIFFMPSRQDFYWKGTDKPLKAFLRLSRERDDVLLITPAWGADTTNALELVEESRGESQVVFLPHVLSKPHLIDLYRVANLVVDQFALGSYGTSTLEAMACGKPVLTHIDADKYRPYLTCLPPNLQAMSEQAILEKMRWAVENRDLLPDVGRESREWVVAEHNRRPIALLEDIIRNHS